MTNRLRLLLSCCVVLFHFGSAVRADEERLEDCVGSTPDPMLQEDGVSGYSRVKKNKFKIVESGVTEGGRKLVLTSSRCTREIRSFQFEFPAKKGVALDDTAYWVKQATESMRKLKISRAFRNAHNKAVAAMKADEAKREPASLAEGTRWEKPVKIHVQEGYRAVNISVEKKGRKFLLTISDESAM